MRHLVVCCDGTWQSALDRTNVWRFYELLDLVADEEKKYVRGVGTGGGVLNRLKGGLTASGLDRTLIEGYRFLVDTYRPGDSVSLFGFSRGAYTARSLAGMIGRIGIVDRTGLHRSELDDAVRQAYQRYMALRTELKEEQGDGPGAGPELVVAVPPRSELPLAYHPASPDIPVAFIGVWDTVGALGIPSYIAVPDVFGSRKRYEFLNVVLDPRVPWARHAVALDEMRGPFRPTLWEEPPAASPQDIEQVWFPGDHQDVGGGRPDTRLSDGTLQWMVTEAAATAGLPFRADGVAALDPTAAPDALHGMASSGALGSVLEAAFQPRPRATPRVDPDVPLPVVAPFAHELQKLTRHLPAAQRYRPSRTLEPGERVEVVVEATRSWNAAGLYVEAGGRYRFVADGQWSTPLGRSGPAGLRRWPVVGDMFGFVVNAVERGLRWLVDNPEAELIGARREADEPLMMLVGLVANEVTDATGEIAIADEKLVIGDSCEATVTRSGYLWAYANDAWGSYGNNDGGVTVTVSRVRSAE